ncbi:MAG: hypothetical protein ACSHYF_06215 [Verrucomicrobiaceae bacterium]
MIRRIDLMQFRDLVCVGWLFFSFSGVLGAQKMPKEDVVEVPAVGEGLSVHNLFQSKMVIQRDKPVALWGWAEAGVEVKVTMKGRSEMVKAGGDRLWRVTFPAMPASGEAMSILVESGGEKVTLENVLVGDVWILGGQSNMEFPLSKVENGNLEIVSANYPEIRILTVPVKAGPEVARSFARLHEWSSWFGQHFRKGDWDVCTPEIARELSAIGYVFARRVHMASQVPIGVIDISRGGTTVETWTPEEVLRGMEDETVKGLLEEWDTKVSEWDAQADLENRIERHHQWVERMTKEGKRTDGRELPTDLRPGPLYDANRPGNCFAGMVGPIKGLAVKGAIFHQGYNNCFKGTEGAVMYRAIFPKMIEAWRGAFNDAEMPFGILSLCTDGTKQTLENYSELMGNAGPLIREAQYQTYLDLVESGDENVGFTSTYDLRRRWYHPQLKVPAGERIARWALVSEYGMEKELRWKPPVLREMKRTKGGLVLEMSEEVSGVDDGGVIEGFAIAGEDRKFHPARADHLEIQKNGQGKPQKERKMILLSSAMVPDPVHFRYAWGRNPMGNLQAHHNTDIPFATQRSDDWPMEEVLVEAGDGTLKIERFEGRKLQAMLRREDEARRVREAEMMIEGQ